jgi:hypothetical protein
VARLKRRHPWRLNRLTSAATASPVRRPARWAASIYVWPLATTSKTFARATSAAGKPSARLTRSKCDRSSGRSDRSGSF